MKTTFLILFLGIFVVACENKASETQNTANADSLAKIRTADSIVALSPLENTNTPQPTGDQPLQKMIGEALKNALSEAELNGILKEGDEFTVFIPNEAGQAQAGIRPSDWKNLLKSYTVKGNFTIPTLDNGQELTTLDGKKLKIEIIEGTLTVGGAEVVEQDLKASNGVLHKINKALVSKK